MHPPFALPLCPVDHCPQPHAADVRDALNSPPVLRIRAGVPLDRALDEGIRAQVLEQSGQVERILREHLESHNVFEFVDTIRRLEKELLEHAPERVPVYLDNHDVFGLVTVIKRLEQAIGQYGSGIRPHVHPGTMARLEREVGQWRSGIGQDRHRDRARAATGEEHTR